MGLDITSKKDYIRFNWAGASGFASWCGDNGLNEPFMFWGGDNSGDEVNPQDDDHKQEIRAWVKKFEQVFPTWGVMGTGETMQNLIWNTPENDDEDEYYKLMAVAWYWFLKDKLRSKESFFYC